MYIRIRGAVANRNAKGAIVNPLAVPERDN